MAKGRIGPSGRCRQAGVGILQVHVPGVLREKRCGYLLRGKLIQFSKSCLTELNSRQNLPFSVDPRKRQLRIPTHFSVIILERISPYIVLS